MKLGIIADIHGNIIAFKACMKFFESQKCDEYIFLGDYVSDTPYNRETMDYIYQIMKLYPCHFIRGNREDYLLRNRRVEKGLEDGPVLLYNSASGNILYTYNQLNDNDFDFFEKMPISMIYEKEGYPSITFCHGSPDNNRELLQLGADNTKEWLKKVDTRYLIAAHTHYPGEFRSDFLVEGVEKIYMNTGSSGIAIADPGIAHCILLEGDSDSWTPQFLRIPFDHHEVINELKTCGVMDVAKWFINNNIHILLTGYDDTPSLILNAMKYQEEETGIKAVWPDIEEKYFERAAGELGILDYSI